MDELDYTDELQWTYSHRVGALRGSSHGGGMAPEGAYLEDFELDRNDTPAYALEWFDALDNDEQRRIEERAEEKILDEF